MKAVYQWLGCVSLCALAGCSSDSVDNVVDIVDTADTVNSVVNPPRQTSYIDAQFYPYGLFVGELASDGETASVFMLIDDTLQTAYRYAFAFLDVGAYNALDNKRFTVPSYQRYVLDETSLLAFIWRGGADEERESNDYLLTYTFDETGQDMDWQILTAKDAVTQEDVVSLVFPTDDDVASMIERHPPYPARDDIVTGQYIVQLDGGILPAYTLTLDVLNDGEISGIDTEGCLFTGQFDVGNEYVNLYNVNLTVDNCEMDGQFTGVMTVSGAIEGKATGLLMFLHNPIRAMALNVSVN